MAQTCLIFRLGMSIGLGNISLGFVQVSLISNRLMTLINVKKEIFLISHSQKSVDGQSACNCITETGQISLYPRNLFLTFRQQIVCKTLSSYCT